MSEMSEIMGKEFLPEENTNILCQCGSHHYHQYHTGKCIRRFGGIYAYCRYFIDRMW